MTINAIVNACNQKSNRSPLMQLSEDEVDEALDELRSLGAVAEIQGDGRKSKYKHRLYEWMGVDKIEMAVMAELLLRGQQTLGELRARASRMEKIDGLQQLKPIITNLLGKGLMIELTPAGRGQIVTHGLYLESELTKIKSSVTQLQSHLEVESSLQMDSENPIANASASEMEKRIAGLEQRIAELEEKLQGL